MSRPVVMRCTSGTIVATGPAMVTAAGADTLSLVPAESIAQNLAFINWTVLTALAVGSFVAVVVGRMRTAATRGFLAFTAFCALGFGALALASDFALPAELAGSPIAANPAFDQPRRAALAIFCVVSAVYLVAIARGTRATVLGVSGVAMGLAVLALAALSWSPDLLTAVPLLVQLAILAAATGGVFAAMILGHWYLVTPKLPEEPLVLFARLLTGVLGLQLVLFLVWVATGAGPAGTSGPFAILVGPWALFVWLRLVVGLLFPLIVSWAALQTARTRSMESATGLLYIGVGAVAAGTILASGLYFGAGLLV
jgi:hypothetical protein